MGASSHMQISRATPPKKRLPRLQTSSSATEHCNKTLLPLTSGWSGLLPPPPLQEYEGAKLDLKLLLSGGPQLGNISNVSASR